MSDDHYRCDDKKKFLVSILVCRASIKKGKAKCRKETCDFHRKRILSSGDGSDSMDISVGNRKIRRKP